MSMAETRGLIRGYLDGDEAELGAVLERLRPRLVLWCASHMSPGLRAKLEPEDAAQEILLRVYAKIGTFRGDNELSFLAWFFKVAENRLRSLSAYFAAGKRQKADLPAFSQTSPSSAAARTERETVLLASLEQLKEDYRLVIRLRCLEGRQVKEVAEILERTPEATRVLYFRAMEALRAIMQREATAYRTGVRN